MSEKESSISVRSRFLKSNKKTNREKNRKLTMISFLPAIIWLILLLVLSSQNGPQTAATSQAASAGAVGTAGAGTTAASSSAAAAAGAGYIVGFYGDSSRELLEEIGLCDELIPDYRNM